jgi:curli biogenesis system outer membrane secretion channel CsgG
LTPPLHRFPVPMRQILLFAAASAVVISCSTSKISIRKDAIKQIKTIAVMPFKSSVADAKVTRESGEAFKGALINAGFQVVEREKLNKVLKEKELAQSGLVENKAIEAGQFLGAEAIMLGEITAHEMTTDEVTVEDTSPQPPLPTGTSPLDRPKRYKKERRDTYQFQIVVRVVSNSDAQTVLTLQNEYPVRSYTASQGSLNPANIDQFRSQVLTQMGKDLEKAIKEAREP